MGRIGKIGREFPNELQMDDNYNRTDSQTYLTGSLFSIVSISYLHKIFYNTVFCVKLRLYLFVCLFDLILYVHSTIFQLCGTVFLG